MPRQEPQGFGADPSVLARRRQEEVHPRVPVIGLVLLVGLDRADDFPFDLDREAGAVFAEDELFSRLLRRRGAEPARDLGLAQDLDEAAQIVGGERAQRDVLPAEDGHQGAVVVPAVLPVPAVVPVVDWGGSPATEATYAAMFRSSSSVSACGPESKRGIGGAASRIWSSVTSKTVLSSKLPPASERAARKASSRLGPTVPAVAASASVWQPPQFLANSVLPLFRSALLDSTARRAQPAVRSAAPASARGRRRRSANG